MKHLVFGTGLIGSHLAGGLISQGIDTVLHGREKSRQTLANGFTVSNFLDKSAALTTPLFLSNRQASPPAFDVIWLTVKCTSLEALIPELRALANQHSTIICCQNGLGSDLMIKSAFPDHTVLTALVGYNVAQPQPNHFHQSTEGMFLLENSAVSRQIVSAASSDILPMSRSDDIVAAQWAKLQLNLANPVNALADIPTKTMLEDATLRRIIAGLMRELLLVAKAKKIQLPTITAIPPTWIPILLSVPNWIFMRVGQKMIGVDPTAKLSMWWDLSGGRKTEIDFLNGALVNEADQLGVKCPMNRSIVNLIHQVEAGEASIGMAASELRSRLTANG